MTPRSNRSLNPFSTAGRKLLGIDAADDRVDPEEIVRRIVVEFSHLGETLLGAKLFRVDAGGQRKQPDVNFAKLSAAAGLLLVPVASLGRGLNGFAVGDLGFLGFDFDFVAAPEPFANELQMQFAHAVDHQLLGLRIAVQADRAHPPRRSCAGRRRVWLRRHGFWATRASPTIGVGS